jgi:hypothetical protein
MPQCTHSQDSTTGKKKRKKETTQHKKGASGVAQGVEHLPSKRETLKKTVYSKNRGLLAFTALFMSALRPSGNHAQVWVYYNSYHHIINSANWQLNMELFVCSHLLFVTFWISMIFRTEKLNFKIDF